MTFKLPDLLRHAVLTISAPRDAARMLIALNIPREIGWQLLALVTVLSVVLIEGATLVLAGLGLPVLMAPVSGPFALAILQASMAVIMIFAVYWGGRAFKGQGRFPDAIILIAWLQFMLLCLQVLQIGFLILIPFMASLLVVLSLVLFFWLLTVFIATMHGFDSLGRVFLSILACIFAVAFALSVLLALIGFQISEIPQNV